LVQQADWYYGERAPPSVIRLSRRKRVTWISSRSLFDLGSIITANVNQSEVLTPSASHLFSSCSRLKRSVFGPRSRLRCGLAFDDNSSSVAYAYWSPFLYNPIAAHPFLYTAISWSLVHSLNHRLRAVRRSDVMVLEVCRSSLMNCDYVTCTESTALAKR